VNCKKSVALWAIVFSSFLSVQAAEDLKIGAVFPMTGTSATFGQESMNGIRLAIEEVNKKGINGRKIKLILEDDKGEPVESANGVRKLINVDKVLAVLGSVASSNTLAGAPIAQDAKIPLLTPASTNEKVTETGDYVSRICFTDSFQGVVMAKFAIEKLKAKTALVILDASSDYSKGLTTFFKKKFQEMGGKIIGDELAYQQKDMDFRTLLRKVKRAKPDVVFLPGYYQEVGLILNQARKQGIMMPFLGGDGWDSSTLQKLSGPEGVQNTYISSHFSPDDKDPKVKAFVDTYTKKFHGRPGAMAALGYDSLMVMADALSRTKQIGVSESLKQAINSTKNFAGVTGMITLDARRNAVKSAVVLKMTPQGSDFEQKVSP
jgi:branched-chain amino acid transport system substrate-binding protein